MTACTRCGSEVIAIPGYETRTLYCSRACEDRAYRRRKKEQAVRDADTLAQARRLAAKIRSRDRRLGDLDALLDLLVGDSS